MRIVFMGSPAFAVPALQALKASTHEVVAVVTQPDRPSGRNLKMHAPAIKVIAQELGLRVLQPVTTRSPELIAEISALHPDLLVVVAYGEILRKNLLDLPSRGAINLHASLLPRYRGAAPVAWSILHGEKETGATTMLINEKMDAGSILLQARCPISPDDTTETLSARIAAVGAPLLATTVDQWGQNQLSPQAQDEALATYAPKLKKSDGLIDWNKPAEWIIRQIRAFQPWPGTFSYLEGHLIKFQRGRVSSESAAMDPGVILSVTGGTVLVACGGGTVLDALELQPQNRSNLKAADFVHGYRVQPGQRFISVTPALS